MKLLSRLNHENVVRYYNSWIETTTIKEDLRDDSSSEVIVQEKIPKILKPDEVCILQQFYKKYFFIFYFIFSLH